MAGNSVYPSISTGTNASKALRSRSYRLHAPRQVGDAEDGVLLVCREVRQDSSVGWLQELDRAPAKDGEQLAQPHQILRPVEERGGIALLRLDVDGLVPEYRVHDDGAVQALRVGAREARVAIARPLHRGANTGAVPEMHVVAHADLVAVIDDRSAGKREQHAREQLEPMAAVVHERRQPAAQADVQASQRIGTLYARYM